MKIAVVSQITARTLLEAHGVSGKKMQGMLID